MIDGKLQEHTRVIGSDRVLLRRYLLVDRYSSGRSTDIKVDKPFMATPRAAAWPQGLQSLLDSILTWTRRKIGNSLILERL